MRRRGRPKHPDILTPREWEVLALLRDKLANPQIAERLGITRDAVKYHVSEIFSKVGVGTREEAAAWRPRERRGWHWKLLWIGGAVGASTATAAVVLVASSAIGTSKESSQFLGTMEPLASDRVGDYDDPHDFRAFA